MIIAAIILYAIFAVVEVKFAVEPVIPPSMFENRSVYALLAIPLLLGGAFIGLIYFLPTYFQIVNGYTATNAGLALIPFLAGVVIVSIAAGVGVTVTGYIVPFFYIGSALLTVGAGLLSTLTQDSTRGQQIGYMIIAGCGIGFMLQTRILSIQASVTQANIASATASSNFFQTLGGVLGIAIVGTAFNNVLASELGPELSLVVSRNPTGVGLLPQADCVKAIAGFTKAFSISYKAIIPMGALILFFALFVKQPRMPSQQKTESAVIVAH
nr:hypothetical protein HK105_000201 [Polyrhizophydium stewartii]